MDGSVTCFVHTSQAAAAAHESAARAARTQDPLCGRRPAQGDVDCHTLLPHLVLLRLCLLADSCRRGAREPCAHRRQLLVRSFASLFYSVECAFCSSQGVQEDDHGPAVQVLGVREPRHVRGLRGQGVARPLPPDVQGWFGLLLLPHGLNLIGCCCCCNADSAPDPGGVDQAAAEAVCGTAERDWPLLGCKSNMASRPSVPSVLTDSFACRFRSTSSRSSRSSRWSTNRSFCARTSESSSASWPQLPLRLNSILCVALAL